MPRHALGVLLALPLVLLGGVGLPAQPPAAPRQPPKILERFQVASLRDGDRTKPVVFSPDGRLLVFVDYRREKNVGYICTLHVRAVEGGRDLWHVEQQGPFGPVAFSPDGRVLAVVAGERVQMREAATGKERRTIPLPETRELCLRHFSTLAFAPDGATLAAVVVENRHLGPGDLDVTKITPVFHLWDVASGKPLRRAAGANGTDNQLVGFTDDGRLLAWQTGPTGQGTDRLVEVLSGRTLFSLGAQQPHVRFGVLSPDRKTCLWPSSKHGDFGVRRWDVERGKDLGSSSGHNGSVLALVYSPDAQVVASAGMDGTVGLWDATTGKALHLLKGHKDAVTGVAFSPDGKTLASGSHDQQVILWDVATGKVRDRLDGHRGRIGYVGFSPDGRVLVSRSTHTNEQGHGIEEATLWDMAILQLPRPKE